MSTKNVAIVRECFEAVRRGVRDSKIVRKLQFLDRADALEAAGLGP